MGVPHQQIFFCLSPNMVRDVAVWWVRLTRIFGTIRCHSVFLIIVTWWLTRRINSRSRSCLHTWMPTTFANASVSFTHGSVGWVETQNLHSMLIDEPARLSWVHWRSSRQLPDLAGFLFFFPKHTRNWPVDIWYRDKTQLFVWLMLVCLHFYFRVILHASAGGLSRQAFMKTTAGGKKLVEACCGPTYMRAIFWAVDPKIWPARRGSWNFVWTCFWIEMLLCVLNVRDS